MKQDVKRKKLLYQSWYRGCRETDKILGNWAKQNIEKLSEAELDELQAILDEYDNDIYDWLCGKQEIPERMVSNSVFQKLRDFKPIEVM